MLSYPINSDIAEALCETPLGSATMAMTVAGLVVRIYFDEEPLGDTAMAEGIAATIRHFTDAGLIVTDVLMVAADAVTFELADPDRIVPRSYLGQVFRISPMPHGRMVAHLGGHMVEFDASPAALLTRDHDSVEVLWESYRGAITVASFRNVCLEE